MSGIPWSPQRKPDIHCNKHPFAQLVTRGCALAALLLGTLVIVSVAPTTWPWQTILGTSTNCVTVKAVPFRTSLAENLSAVVRPLETAPPANRDLVSVVLMNFDRPENIKKIVQTFADYTHVGEILICNIKEDTAVQIAHPKVKVQNCTQLDKQHGLNVRFLLCQQAAYQTVLIHDDDLLTSEITLNVMLQWFQLDPRRVYGVHGRIPKKGMVYDWNSICWGESMPCPVILTLSMLVHRDLCSAYFNYTSQMEDFVVERARPYWNGEDILMSLVSIKEYGQLPFYVSGIPVPKKLPAGESWVSGWPGHAAYRTDFLRLAVKRLKLESWFAEYS